MNVFWIMATIYVEAAFKETNWIKISYQIINARLKIQFLSQETRWYDTVQEKIS